ncbi:zinc-dependent alcohol dehydrogenase [Microterricola pindariensis]|uniref:Alcohol dehydrogenase n=1 Tax=Microterricola pindariensis TaxID=478010 RepID=A0ABX5B120_9MICO|nr:alcohol dehydrogenase catalytic domain-containing protein [Microterricola pindariensis]PPL20378.1 alcohol dehydrogenase [Microterricola pindariensis]
MTSIPSSRRRARASAINVVEIVEEPTPEIAEHEALVSMLVSGVCGSDTHALHGRHPMMPLPYYPGHEVVGIVEAVGSAVTAVAVGDRVTPEPTLPCGDCKMCKTGRSNVCDNLQFFGCGFREGGMADLFSVDASRLHIIPAELSNEQAAIIEPLATPVHALRLAGDVAGKTVVVLGCGTIGLLVLAAARHRGARAVVMTDMIESKRELALRAGADAVFDASSPELSANVRDYFGETADFVFDCVSVQSTLDSAFAMVGKGGTVVVVGVPQKPVTVPLPDIQDKQIRLQGAATYLAEDYAEATEIIRSGGVSADIIISNTFPLEQAAEAFAAATSGTEVKVLVTR